jgi:uncharacterized protein YaiL (DUF2058 family)
MSDSLRDQLLKSGLVQKLKSEAKPVPKSAPASNSGPTKHHSRPPSRPQQGAKPNQPAKPQQAAPRAIGVDEADLARAYALRARQEREERERQQREAERAAREKKERKQKLATLLDGKALNSTEADLPRHFPHGNKIRRIYCTADQLARLNRGELAVVQLSGRYLLVEQAVALQAKAIQDEALVLLCDPNAPTDDDVPADLVW